MDNCTTLTFKGVTFNFPTGTDCGYRLVVQVFGEQLSSTMAPPAVPTWEQVAAEIDSEVEKAVKGASPVDEAVATMQEEASRIGTGL